MDITEIEIEFNDNENSEKPFSTKDIKISNQVIALSSIIDRLKYDEIDLNPDFQRNGDLWDNKKMSQLIESIILRLPLPVFYFDVSTPEKWIIVDGLQRLLTIKKFTVEKKLKLKGLEFLVDLNGKTYKDLDRGTQRIINETQIITYQIEAQTPKAVRYSIFKRINTGGLNLNAQEIRQALNQEGEGVNFLKEVSEENIFKRVVNVSPKRMLDRELILRFIAFFLTSYNEFSFNTIGEFLDHSMEKLDSIKDQNRLSEIKNQLLESLAFSEMILGEKHHFSRAIALPGNTKSLNRSLFDVITVSFAQLSEDKRNKLFLKKDCFKQTFIKLLEDEKSDFSEAITKGTSGKRAVETRFNVMASLIKEVLNEN